MQESKAVSKYNIFQAIVMSFYSKNLYRDVAMNWGGKAFLYLLLLVTLVSIYFAFSMQVITNIAYETLYTKISPQVPELTIKNGKITTPENRPYIITDPDTKYTFAIIDTSGQYTSIEQADAPLLVTQTQVISRSKPQETKIYTLPADLSQNVDPKQVNTFIEKYMGFLWIFFFIFALFIFYIYRVIQALLYSIIGKIFAVVFKVPVSYAQILQIMLVAITPVMIISTIQHAFSITLQHELSLYFLLAMLYLFYGIYANKN